MYLFHNMVHSEAVVQRTLSGVLEQLRQGSNHDSKNDNMFTATLIKWVFIHSCGGFEWFLRSRIDILGFVIVNTFCFSSNIVIFNPCMFKQFWHSVLNNVQSQIVFAHCLNQVMKKCNFRRWVYLQSMLKQSLVTII